MNRIPRRQFLKQATLAAACGRTSSGVATGRNAGEFRNEP